MFLVVSAPPRDSLWDKRTNTSLNVIAFIAPAAHDPTSTPKMQRDGRGNATELQGRSREKARERKGKFQRRQHILQRQRTSSTTQPASIHHSNATQANGHSNTLYQPPRKMKGISKEKGITCEMQRNAAGLQGKCNGNTRKTQGNEEARPASRLLRAQAQSRILPRFIPSQIKRRYTTARKQTTSPPHYLTTSSTPQPASRLHRRNVATSTYNLQCTSYTQVTYNLPTVPPTIYNLRSKINTSIF